MTEKNVKHVIVVTDDTHGNQALYVDGTLAMQDDTIYSCDIAEHAGNGLVDFSHVICEMPEDVEEFPEQFEQVMLWIPK